MADAFRAIFQWCNTQSLGPFTINTYFIICLILSALVLFLRGNK